MTYVLKIFIENEELRQKYEISINEHNKQIYNRFHNAGFDLFCPEEISLNNNKVELNTKIVCAMYDLYEQPVAFYLYPRSSISKTNLILANSVGIIDNSYRGNIIGKFNNLKPEDLHLEKYSRLLQICSPLLQPFKVEIVNNLDELETTERGSGGFGSTGI